MRAARVLLALLGSASLAVLLMIPLHDNATAAQAMYQLRKLLRRIRWPV
jgi:hypothetical protein